MNQTAHPRRARPMLPLRVRQYFRVAEFVAKATRDVDRLAASGAITRDEAASTRSAITWLGYLAGRRSRGTDALQRGQ